VRLAASNIAWRRDEDTLIAPLLIEYGVTGVEIAPSVIWERPAEASREAALAYRERWRHSGLNIVAMQSLLFGRPDLVIFGPGAVWRETVEYLRHIMTLASWLGATRLVFGAPGNRRVGELDEASRDHQASAFFSEAGRIASDLGLMLCIEPNPVEYGCEYVRTSAEGAALVRSLGVSGLGLHLDAGAMTLAGESAAPAIREAATVLHHFHASEPFLAPLGSGAVDHRTVGAALAEVEYEGWVSLEMRRVPEDVVGSLRGALATLRRCYGSPN
jgi:D-psicose/D-tagatose/L-ribulose 3-epimerase